MYMLSMTIMYLLLITLMKPTQGSLEVIKLDWSSTNVVMIMRILTACITLLLLRHIKYKIIVELTVEPAATILISMILRSRSSNHAQDTSHSHDTMTMMSSISALLCHTTAMVMIVVPYSYDTIIVLVRDMIIVLIIFSSF